MKLLYEPFVSKFTIVCLVLAFTMLVCTAQSQLLEENFNYSSGLTLTAFGWTGVQTGTSPTLVANSGLSYTGYASSGIGYAALINANSTVLPESYGKSFSAQTSGSVYVSFLVNASACDVAGSQSFVLFLKSPTTAAYGRFHMNGDGSTGVQFGIAQFTESPVYTSFVYSLNTTYLVVLKYTFVTGSTNDQISLFVFTGSAPPASEPGTPTLGPVSSSNTDPSDIEMVVLKRVAISTNNILIDGIRVSTNWNQAPLPVELTSFNSIVYKDVVKLNWKTATEIGNYGFDIEKRNISDQSTVMNWSKVGFVQGAGTSNIPKEYSFSDKDLSAGKYSYRLKQIDRDGKFKYSHTVEVTVADVPKIFFLEQNYPNPFNPTTAISYHLSANGLTTLKVYDAIGRETATLVNEVKEAGTYSVSFDGSKLSSGIYVTRLQSGNAVLLKKMILLK